MKRRFNIPSDNELEDFGYDKETLKKKSKESKD